MTRAADIRALAPFLARLSGAGGWLALGALLATLTLIGSLGLLSLSGAFLSGAALAGLTPASAILFNFFWPGAGVRLFALLRTVCRWGDRVVTHEGVFRLLAGLRVWLYHRLARLSPRQIASLHGGETLSRLMRDIDALDGLYPRLLLPAFAALLAFAGMALVFAWMAPQLIALPLLFLFAVLCLLPLAGWRLGLRVLPELIHGRTAVRSKLIDCLEGMADFSLPAPAWAGQRQHTLATAERWLGHQAQSARRAALLRALVSVLVGLGAWVCFGVLASQPPALRVEGPWLAALTLLTLGCAEALLPLASAAIELPATATAAANIEALASQAPTPHYPATGAQPGDGSIQIDSLQFAWDAHTPVFADLNLTIASGQHVLITGASGSGKSTLAYLLTRQEDPHAGCIQVGGVGLEELDESTLRRHIACAGQFSWVKTATLADNLRLAQPDIDAKDMQAILSLVGLEPDSLGWQDGWDTWIEEGGASLSGGQRKRLGIAQALLRRAAITIFDEPSEGLDPAAEHQLIEKITQYLRGKTLIWISHRAVADGHFDRAIQLEPCRAT